MNNNVANKDPAIKRDSFSELLGQLANNFSTVVHEELELLMQRIREKVTAVRGGILAVVIGLVISLAAVMSLCAALIIKLTSFMDPVMAALVTGTALAITGVVIAFIGYEKLKKSILNT